MFVLLYLGLIVKEDEFTPGSPHGPSHGGPRVRGEDLHLVPGRHFPPLHVTGVLVQVTQPHRLVLLGRTHELHPALAIVLHREDVTLFVLPILDDGLLVNLDNPAG